MSNNDDPLASERNVWRPLQAANVPSEVWEQYHHQSPNMGVFRRWLISAYSQQVGVEFEIGTSTQQQVKSFAAWLNYQASESEFLLSFRKYPTLQAVFFGDYAGKIMTVAQRHCHICGMGRPMGDMLPVNSFSIRIAPISRQAAGPRISKAFKRALSAYFARRGAANGPMDLGPIGRLCLALTFVLSNRSRDKDLDNMTKALQDALADALGFNDRHVHHLDVVKLVLPDVEEWVLVRLAPSALNEHSDVIAPTMNLAWAGKERIDLTEFMEGGEEG